MLFLSLSASEEKQCLLWSHPVQQAGLLTWTSSGYIVLLSSVLLGTVHAGSVGTDQLHPHRNSCYDCTQINSFCESRHSDCNSLVPWSVLLLFSTFPSSLSVCYTFYFCCLLQTYRQHKAYKHFPILLVSGNSSILIYTFYVWSSLSETVLNVWDDEQSKSIVKLWIIKGIFF